MTVAFGWIDNGNVDGQWAGCMMDSLRAHPDIWGDRIRGSSGANVSKARNEVARRFLDESEDEWLLMVDADLLFAPDFILGLLEAADPIERPVISGLYFAQESAPEAVMPSLRPLIFQFNEENVFDSIKRYQQNSLMQVNGAPTGMLLVHRTALEKTRGDKLFPWFYEQIIVGSSGEERWVSEDLTFSLVLQAAGIPIYIHTGIACAHRKTYLLTEELYIALGGPVEIPSED